VPGDVAAADVGNAFESADIDYLSAEIESRGCGVR
jgi:hypothetical protein